MKRHALYLVRCLVRRKPDDVGERPILGICMEAQSVGKKISVACILSTCINFEKRLLRDFISFAKMRSF